MLSSRDEPELDVRMPALVVKTSRNAVQHGTLGIARSLGRLAVPVYAIVEDRFAPVTASHFLSGGFVAPAWPDGPIGWVANLQEIGKRLGRPAVLIPTDDQAAIWIAEFADLLAKWFEFPPVPRELPRVLANKKELYFLCRRLGVPCPDTAFPNCLEEVRDFIRHAIFPVAFKEAENGSGKKRVRSVQIMETAEDLLSEFLRRQELSAPNLILQEYIPRACAEDWIYHGYLNPKTGCLIGFTGKKLRSYPPFAGSTTLGVSVSNEDLRQEAEQLLRTISYAGIVDLDYRYDRRDGRYKLLDFNPRVGANFRMFEDGAGMDVVRALHLDLTGRKVHQRHPSPSRTFLVEPYDLFATVTYLRRGGLTFSRWCQTLRGRIEPAWFSWDDPLPFAGMCLRLLLRAASRIGLLWAKTPPPAAAPTHTRRRG